MKTALRWLLLIFMTFWLVGCGLKGPLVKPPTEPTEVIAQN